MILRNADYTWKERVFKLYLTELNIAEGGKKSFTDTSDTDTYIRTMYARGMYNILYRSSSQEKFRVTQKFN